MNGTFYNATAFDQDISSWDVTALTNATEMFNGVQLSTANYDALLIGWDAQTLQPGVTFDGGLSTYCTGEAARTSMTSSDSWTITDGGKECPPPPTDDFVITVNTSLGASDLSFTIPTYAHWGETYDYNVDCNNDGVDEATGQTGDYSCMYPSAGTYTIRIKDNTGSGTGFPRIYFFNDIDDANEKIMEINQWGTGKWTSMTNAFYDCPNVVGAASDKPDFSNVSSLYGMFYHASNFNQDIGDWDTSNIINLGWMFYGAEDFNQDISSWDTSNVLSMNLTFGAASSFNQYIGGWDTSNVISMVAMFQGSGFHQDISSWDTSSVTDMSYMFRWNCHAPDISGWDVSSLTSAEGMYDGCAGFQTYDYDALLIGWSAQTLQSGVLFDAGGSKYCTGETARSDMITLDSCIITDGGKDCTPPPDTSLDVHPPDPSNNDSPSFEFSSPDLTATFRCQLDGTWYLGDCTSPFGYTSLAEGPHTFIVAAVDFGNRDGLNPGKLFLDDPYNPTDGREQSAPANSDPDQRIQR